MPLSPHDHVSIQIDSTGVGRKPSLRESLATLRNSLKRSSASPVKDLCPTRRVSVRDRRAVLATTADLLPSLVELSGVSEAGASQSSPSHATDQGMISEHIPRPLLARSRVIPRLASSFVSPAIQFGSKMLKPNQAREAFVAPVRSAKLNVKRWLRVSILSTLVFGLLAISWHALNCHLWIQLLNMDRAYFLVLPPAIGTVLVLVAGVNMWWWVSSLPDAILLKAIAEGLGVDDEGIETFRTAAVQFNRTVESLEQARLPHIYCMSTACALSAHYMRTACALHAH